MGSKRPPSLRPSLALCDVDDWARSAWDRYKVGERVEFLLALEFARGGSPFSDPVRCTFEAIPDPAAAPAAADDFGDIAADTMLLRRVS